MSWTEHTFSKNFLTEEWLKTGFWTRKMNLKSVEERPPGENTKNTSCALKMTGWWYFYLLHLSQESNWKFGKTSNSEMSCELKYCYLKVNRKHCLIPRMPVQFSAVFMASVQLMSGTNLRTEPGNAPLSHKGVKKSLLKLRQWQLYNINYTFKLNEFAI